MINKEYLKEMGLSEEVIASILKHEEEDNGRTKFKQSLSDAIKEMEPQDEEIILKLFETKGLHLENGEIEGLKERLLAFKEKYPFLFKENDLPKIVSSTNAKKGITVERFKKMSYKERADLYKKNPKLYNELLNA